MKAEMMFTGAKYIDQVLDDHLMMMLMVTTMQTITPSPTQR
jgi:hypothetical protein